MLANLADDKERALYEGLGATWDPSNPGLYLNYDWHDIPTPGRAALSGRQTLEVTGPARRPKRGAAAAAAADQLPETRSLIEYEPVDRAVPNNNNNDAPEGQQMRYQIGRARHTWITSFRNTLVDFDVSVIGLSSVKESVGELIQNLILWETHVGFLNFGIFGNPGTGKTYLSSKLSEILYRLGYAPVKTTAQYTRLTKPDFIAPFQGQSAHLTRLAMLRGLGTFMAIDEAYQLVTGAGDSYGKEALTQIVNDMDEYKGMSMVAFLGYQRLIVRNLFVANEGLERRISYIWRIAPYTPAEMMAIIKREFVEAKFVRVTTPGADAKEEKSRVNCLDIIDALYQKGAFTRVNAGAAAPIVEEYKSVYSLAAYSSTKTAAERQTLATADRRLWFSWKTLEEALKVYAHKTAGLDLLYFDGVPQAEVPKHPPRLDDDPDTDGGEEEGSSTGGLRTPGIPRSVPAAASD